MNQVLIIAFILFIALVAMRCFEMKKESQTGVSKFLRKGDIHVEKFYGYVKNLGNSVLDYLVHAKHLSIKKTWDSITHSVHFTKKKVDTLHDKLNGKGEVKKSDHVSFYLQSVSDHKKTMRDNQK